MALSRKVINFKFQTIDEIVEKTKEGTVEKTIDKIIKMINVVFEYSQTVDAWIDLQKLGCKGFIINERIGYIFSN